MDMETDVGAKFSGIKHVFFWSSLRVSSWVSLRRKFVGGQIQGFEILRPSIIFAISSCHIMIYGPQKLKRQSKEFGHRARMSATQRATEIKKNCSFILSHSQKICLGIVYNVVANLPKTGSLLAKSSLFSRAKGLTKQ